MQEGSYRFSATTMVCHPVVLDHFAYHFAVDEYLRDVGAEAVDHLLEERGGVADGGPVTHGPHVAVQQLQAVVNCW